MSNKIYFFLIFFFIQFRVTPFLFSQDINADKLNVVFILADDLGYADLTCYGNKYNETPHIDDLAKQAVRFSDAYASSPVCSPTRASLLTGKYPTSLKLTNFIPGWQNRKGYDNSKPLIEPDFIQYLTHEEITLAEVLDQCGYKTASIGKWHLGEVDYYPQTHGFDVNIGGCHMGYPASYFYPYKRGGSNAFSLPNLEHGREGEYLTDRLTEEATKYIRENKNVPFFLFLSHYAVHTPMKAKEKLIDKYKQKAKSMPDNTFTNPYYAAMLESLDEGVGKVIATLKDLDIYNKTVVIFASDNGGLAHEIGNEHTPATSNFPLRQGKGFLSEGGIRVPLIVRWPGAVDQGRVSKVVTSTIDFFPTILAILNIDYDQSKIDGINLANHLKSGDLVDRDAIFWHFPHYHSIGSTPSSAARYKNFKYIYYYEDNKEELYDLSNDLGETTNIAKENKAILRECRTLLSNWKIKTSAASPRYNPVYQKNK